MALVALHQSFILVLVGEGTLFVAESVERVEEQVLVEAPEGENKKAQDSYLLEGRIVVKSQV